MIGARLWQVITLRRLLNLQLSTLVAVVTWNKTIKDSRAITNRVDKENTTNWNYKHGPHNILIQIKLPLCIYFLQYHLCSGGHMLDCADCSNTHQTQVGNEMLNPESVRSEFHALSVITKCSNFL